MILSASWDILLALFHVLTVFKTLLPTLPCFKFLSTQLLNQMQPFLSNSISSATVPTLFPSAWGCCHSCSYGQGAMPLNFAREEQVQLLALLRNPLHYLFQRQSPLRFLNGRGELGKQAGRCLCKKKKPLLINKSSRFCFSNEINNATTA